MADTENPYQSPVADLSPTSSAASGEMYTQIMLKALKDTKPWVRFLSILGFVGSGLMFLAGLITMIAGAFSSSMGGGFGGGFGALIGVIYIIMGALYILPCVHLHRYANAIGQAAQGAGTPAVEDALIKQKGFWRTVGIMALVIIGLYFLALFIGVIVGVVSTMGKM